MLSDNDGSHLSNFLSRFTHPARLSTAYLSAADVLYRLADMEIEAATFYRGLAQYSDLEWVKVFARNLAEAEMRHRTYFLELASAAKSTHGQQQHAGPLPPELANLLNTPLTLRPESVSRTALYYGERDAIQFAILTEENTILLLKKLRPFVPADQHVHIDIVFEEEKTHKRMLEELWHKHFADAPSQ